jgi:hypothetical protein
MKIATEFQIGDVAYIPAIKPSEYHSFDEVIVADINIQVSNLKILYSVETTEGRTTAVSPDKIYKSPSLIPATEKEYELLKLCGELMSFITNIPADFIPRTKEAKDIVTYFKAKNPEVPAEVKAETGPEQKRRKKSEYMREYMSIPEHRERLREYQKEYYRRPEVKARRSEQRRLRYQQKKAEKAAVSA